MDLERFDPAADTGQVRACHEIYLAGAAQDDPHEPAMSFPGFRGWLMYGWTEDPCEAWLARDVAGAACGWFVLTLPQRENRKHAYLHTYVHLARRRAGVGRALFGHAAARALRGGRSLLTGEAREASPGEAFARALGARQGIFDVRRLLRVDAIPAAHLATLRERARAASPGYSLLTWRGPVPPQHLAAVAAINAAEGDMPMDAWREPPYWDADRVRLCGLRADAQGLHWYTVAARHDASGELAGLTQLGVDPLIPGWGFQELTAVTKPHRGHRLGLLVKVGMLDLLADREPGLRRIITGNGDANEHIIAINASLGFEVLDRWSTWEMEVATAVTLGSRRPDVIGQS
jgi:GNAT superfamily N-acetyltransferase